MIAAAYVGCRNIFLIEEATRIALRLAVVELDGEESELNSLDV